MSPMEGKEAQMRRFVSLFVTSAACIAISGSTLGASSAAKPAWRWTLEERLAARADPTGTAERLKHAHRQVFTPRVAATSPTDVSSEQVDYISGREHPELLVARQLFDYMMTMAYADDPNSREIFREAKAPQLKASGLPADFWQRMEAIGIAYLGDTRQLRDLHKTPARNAIVEQRVGRESASLETLRCRDRALALTVARREFGEPFDRFLYEAIAPSITISIFRGGEISPEREREIERGCR